MNRSGFTVVELSLVVLVAGSVGAVLAPIGNQVQKANLETKSQWVHHDLARRQFVYMGDHDGAFSGPNTSGLEWNRRSFFPGAGEVLRWRELEQPQSADTPTSISDWISPIVGSALGFSENRAERIYQLYEQVLDPTTTRDVDVLFYLASGSPSDLKQLESILVINGIRQSSFMMMRSFTHFSSLHTATEFVDGPGSVNFQHYATQLPSDVTMTPEGYAPNVWNVGMQPSNKVMFADGTRYFEDSFGLSVDVQSEQSLFSDHTSSGPIYDQSIAYGRNAFQSPSQTNLELSYRKNGGEGFYVTMFDGSLQYMTREQSWTDPTPWYPSGSVWQGNGATPEAAAWVQKNLPGGVIH